ncbi:hypothetical protein P2G88_11885 [Aliiglaciecola sp. CAU 1673]|uniref:hypothetical protein n=1 Tax=Aliiglaciecola sp. CAU 1673 TaxID=3032595 RepID=UPI0023DC1A92|nr:hypothetical protein [Aliiglaciecola sp. CAU 1673]MDF2178951.1 hypothetical protein [Aliiglaciecola sp. CAU 1673]
MRDAQSGRYESSGEGPSIRFYINDIGVLLSRLIADDEATQAEQRKMMVQIFKNAFPDSASIGISGSRGTHPHRSLC